MQAHGLLIYFSGNRRFRLALRLRFAKENKFATARQSCRAGTPLAAPQMGTFLREIWDFDGAGGITEFAQTWSGPAL